MSTLYENQSAIQNSPPSPFMQLVHAILDSPPSTAIRVALERLRARRMTIGQGNEVIGRPDLRVGRNVIEQFRIDALNAREESLVKEAWDAKCAQARAEHADMQAQRTALSTRVRGTSATLDQHILALAPLVLEYRDTMAEHLRVGQQMDYLRGAFGLDDLRPGGSSVPTPDARTILFRAVRRLDERGAFITPQAGK